jgi:hypothetical protein
LAIVPGVVYKGRAAVTSALLIFAATYLVLVTGELPGFHVYRTSAALIGAVCMVVFGVLPPDHLLGVIHASRCAADGAQCSRWVDDSGHVGAVIGEAVVLFTPDPASAAYSQSRMSLVKRATIFARR